MAVKKNIEKQKLLKLISQVPFTEDDKKKWQTEIEENDLSELLLDDVHQKFKDLPAEGFQSDWARMKYSTDLGKFIQQWRMGLASKNFRRGH